MSIALRPYQTKMIRQIRQAWADGAINVGVSSPTGSGKTFLFASVLSEHDGYACAIAHRRELVGQMSTTLARLGVRHRVIAPASVIAEIVRLHIRAVGTSFFDANARVAVASVQTLARRDGLDWAKRVSLWICDECFPAGTPVDGRPIETLRVGDFVTAFDEVTGAFARKRVARVFRNPQPDYMMRVAVSKHHVICCTPSHPFWTKRGWVEAAFLLPSDEVLVDELHSMRRRDHGDERAPEVPLPEGGADILHDEMRHDLPGTVSDRCVEAAKQQETNRDSTSPAALHGVRPPRGFERASLTSVEAHGEGVLRSGMLQTLPGSAIFGNNVPYEFAIRLGAHDGPQSHEAAGDPQEGVGVFTGDKPQASDSRGEWEGPPSRGEVSVHAVREHGVCAATGDSHLPEAGERSRCPANIQAGFGKPRNENRFGSRRQFSQCAAPTRTRSSEERVFKWARLDGVEIYEPSDPGAAGRSGSDGFVYNIEVEDLHTYVADGVVVHNCHHLLAKNVWGEALARFPNARGLGVTATPVRADGKGLGRHADGLIDALIVGPAVRDLIDQGYLTDYRIFAPQSDINLALVPVSATTGDFNPAALRDAAAKSHITGDLVSNYLRIAPGKLGVTFCVSVELAMETAARYRDAGVPAECVSAETPDLIRAQTLERFARREILQLTNVDLFGEGFDLPAIEVVSMGRPTESFALYRQQVGRALRPMEGKGSAIIIDHGGNVLRHGLPDAHREWTLDRRERRSRSAPDDTQMLRACPECTGVYERFRRACPYCGHVPVPISRAAPEFVDGDLLELDPAVLARLRGEAEPKPVVYPYGATPVVRGALDKHHRERAAAQQALRSAISWWAGWQRSLGRDDHESYRRFYLAFGVDVATAQTLGRADADALGLRVVEAMAAAGVPVTEGLAA